jgi:hypothetical protein
MERATGFEPATFSLGSLHSTPELRPHASHFYHKPASVCNLRVRRSAPQAGFDVAVPRGLFLNLPEDLPRLAPPSHVLEKHRLVV